jgi:hypothetical protein
MTDLSEVNDSFLKPAKVNFLNLFFLLFIWIYDFDWYSIDPLSLLKKKLGVLNFQKYSV